MTEQTRRRRRGAWAATVVVGAGSFLLLQSAPAYADTQNDYINAVAPAGQRVQTDFGVPASVAIGQSILESAWGRSALAVNDRNYFGFKCRSSGDPGPIATGCRAYQTEECTPACHPETAYFRVYRSVEDSFQDYGRLLRDSDRYNAAFDYTNDPDQFIREVHAGGYATDPDYANKVITLMTTYDLYRFNAAAPPPPPSERRGASGGLAVSWDTGRLDAFGRGGGGQAYTNYFHRGAASWPDWRALAGSSGLRSRPVAVSWGAGRLDVFAVGLDSRLKHWWFDRAGDNRWRGPETIGDATVIGNPAVVTYDPGRIDVFVRDTANRLRHNYVQRGVASWPAWETLGSDLGGDPAAVQWHAGRWDVFALGSAKTMQHWWFDRLGDSTWHGPQVIGDTTFTGSPAVVSWAPGRIDVFARDTANRLRHNYVQSGVIAWPAWETWGNGVTSDPTAASWVLGRLDVFAVDGNHRLRHWWFDRLAGDTTRRGPEEIGDTTFTGTPGTLGVVAWLPGRLDIFGVDTDNTMRHNHWQHDVTDGWAGWEHLGGTFQ